VQFLREGSKQVKKLIAGPSVYICDECIDLCNDIIADDSVTARVVLDDLPTPREISAFLDEFVHRPGRAKKILAVACTTIQAHSNRPVHDDDVEVAKSNVLLLGPTGCGKTFSPDVARMLNVPFAIADANRADRGRLRRRGRRNISWKLLSAADST